jgi:DNA-binding IclR family transcriptional regulator
MLGVDVKLGSHDLLGRSLGDTATLRTALPPHISLPPRAVDMSHATMLGELSRVTTRGFAEYEHPELGIAAIGVAVRVAPARDVGFALCIGREAMPRAMRTEIISALMETARDVVGLCGDPALMVPPPPRRD